MENYLGIFILDGAIYENKKDGRVPRLFYICASEDA